MDGLLPGPTVSSSASQQVYVDFFLNAFIWLPGPAAVNWSLLFSLNCFPEL